MTVAITRLDLSASDLRQAAARTQDAKVARRMLAIALVLEGVSRTDAAESCAMDRQTLRDWVHRFNERGPEGLKDDLARPRPRRLTAAQEAELATIVETGPDRAVHGVVRWRRVDLRALVAARFGVEYHERTIGKLLKPLGFSHVSARRRHPKQDGEVIQAFKKTFRARSKPTLAG